MDAAPTLEAALESANNHAIARLRADCTPELMNNVYEKLGRGVRVSSKHVRDAGVNERDLFCMQASGYARESSSFNVGDQVTINWIIFF